MVVGKVGGSGKLGSVVWGKLEGELEGVGSVGNVGWLEIVVCWEGRSGLGSLWVGESGFKKLNLSLWVGEGE